MQTTLKGVSRIMSIVRNRSGHLYCLHFLLICAASIYCPKSAFAQTTDASSQQAQEAQTVSGASSSSDQASENQQEPSTQPAICGVKHLGQCLKDIGHDQAGIWTSPITSSAQRCHLAFAICRSHWSCDALRRASTAESWHRQK